MANSEVTGSAAGGLNVCCEAVLSAVVGAASRCRSVATTAKRADIAESSEAVVKGTGSVTGVSSDSGLLVKRRGVGKVD
jgi:hypothetical protein